MMIHGQSWFLFSNLWCVVRALNFSSTCGNLTRSLPNVLKPEASISINCRTERVNEFISAPKGKCLDFSYFDTKRTFQSLSLSLPPFSPSLSFAMFLYAFLHSFSFVLPVAHRNHREDRRDPRQKLVLAEGPWMILRQEKGRQRELVFLLFNGMQSEVENQRPLLDFLYKARMPLEIDILSSSTS